MAVTESFLPSFNRVGDPRRVIEKVGWDFSLVLWQMQYCTITSLHVREVEDRIQALPRSHLTFKYLEPTLADERDGEGTFVGLTGHARANKKWHDHKKETDPTFAPKKAERERIRWAKAPQAVRDAKTLAQKRRRQQATPEEREAENAARRLRRQQKKQQEREALAALGVGNNNGNDGAPGEDAATDLLVVEGNGALVEVGLDGNALPGDGSGNAAENDSVGRESDGGGGQFGFDKTVLHAAPIHREEQHEAPAVGDLESGGGGALLYDDDVFYDAENGD
jgi:hypothetical protein